MGWLMSDSDYRYIHDGIKSVPLFRKEIAEYEKNIILATPTHDDNGGGRSNIPSRPVENMVENLVKDKRMQRLKELVYYTDFALGELDEEKRRFITTVFWGNKTISGIKEEFHISYHTYRNWKKAFVLRVGKLTGDKR